MQHISTILPTYLDNLLYKIWRADRDYWQQFTHTKPIYDPFEVFKPSKAFLNEVIKQLNKQCDEINKKKIQIRQDDQTPDWLKECGIEDCDKHLKPKLSRIKLYKFRIRSSTEKGGAGGNGITDFDIKTAKSRPILDLYPGKLKRAGNRLLGKCPFHKNGQEKTPSFIIDQKNRFHCFACGVDGDIIEFVKKEQNLNFIEAVKYILQK